MYGSAQYQSTQKNTLPCALLDLRRLITVNVLNIISVLLNQENKISLTYVNKLNTKNGAEILLWYYYCVSRLLPSAWIRMLVEDSSPSDTLIEAPSIFHSEFLHSEYLIRGNNFRRLFENCENFSQFHNCSIHWRSLWISRHLWNK